MPTLLVHGRQDIIPVDASVKIQKVIPGAKMSALQDCGHFPYIEKPDEFFQTIKDFIKK